MITQLTESRPAVRHEDGTTTVTLSGAAAWEGGNLIASQLVDAFAQEVGRRRLLLDCGRVEHLSSEGLGTLVGLHKALEASGGWLVLTHVQPRVYEILERTHLTSFLDVRPERPAGIFAVEREGETLVVTPLADLRELAYPQLEAGARDVVDLLRSGAVKNVVLDFHRTDYYGSTALEFFVKVWKRVRERQGRMAFCNLSGHELEILRLTSLDRLWPLCPSRKEALEAVRGKPAG